MKRMNGKVTIVILFAALIGCILATGTATAAPSTSGNSESLAKPNQNEYHKEFCRTRRQVF